MSGIICFDNHIYVFRVWFVCWALISVLQPLSPSMQPLLFASLSFNSLCLFVVALYYCHLLNEYFGNATVVIHSDEVRISHIVITVLFLAHCKYIVHCNKAIVVLNITYVILISNYTLHPFSTPKPLWVHKNRFYAIFPSYEFSKKSYFDLKRIVIKCNKIKLWIYEEKSNFFPFHWIFMLNWEKT